MRLTTDLRLGAGWGINLAVADYVIHRSPIRAVGMRKTRRQDPAEVAQTGRVGVFQFQHKPSERKGRESH
jgi:hypothetical protein